MAPTLMQIKAAFPCRDTEIDALGQLLHMQTLSSGSVWSKLLPTPTRVPYILIQGGHNSGKTSIIKSLVDSLEQVKSTYIDCKKCVASRSLFEFIIDDICHHHFTIDESGVLQRDGPSVDNLEAFLIQLRAVLSQKATNTERIIVLDHFSLAPYEEGMAILTEIYDLLMRYDSDITFVFIVSDYGEMHNLVMPTITFPRYTKEQICHILRGSAPIEMDLKDTNIADEEELSECWSRFIKTVYETFHEVIRDDIDLLCTVAHKIFPQYIQPVLDNDLSAKSHLQLKHRAQKALVPEPWILAEESLSIMDRSGDEQKLRLQELSSCSRYLLIAAYLASYNHRKTDRMIHSRGRGIKTKRRGGKSAANRITKQSQRLLGPRGFVLERMVAIFESIAPFIVQHNALLDQQMAVLCSLKLLIRQGAAADLLDDGKWLVNVSYAMITKVAQSVGFEIYKYLISD